MATAFSNQGPNAAADEYTLFMTMLQAVLSQVQTVSIVRVESCTNTGGVVGSGSVDVTVLANLITAGGQSVPHAVIGNVPFQRVQAGGNAIIIDPQPGDIGICLFCSRDSSAVIAAKAQANPGSARTFDWADGLYIGSILTGVPTQYLRFTSAGVTLLSPDAVTVQAPVITLDGNTTVDGTLTVTEAVVLDSTLEVTGMSTLAAVSATTIAAPAGTITALDVGTISPIGGGHFTTPSFPVLSQDSVTGDGLTTPLQLVGDVLAPGATFYYGTNASGVKGWYVLTGGGGGGGTVTSVGLASSAATITVTGATPITSAGAWNIDLSAAAQASLALANSALQSVVQGTGITVTGGNIVNLSTATQALLVLAGTALQTAVTSVGLTVNATYIALTGASPITGTGTWALDLSTAAKASLALANSALQSVVQGTGITVTGGNVVNLSTATQASLLLANSAVQPGAIEFILKLGGWNSTSAPLTPSLTVPQDTIIPYGVTLQEIYIVTQGPSGTTVSGSCTVDLVTSAAFPTVPSVDITGGVPPAISAGSSYSNTTFSGWTTAFALNSMIRATLAANSGFYSIVIYGRFK